MAELIVPDWFDPWFEGLFTEAAYHPAGVASRLRLDNETVSDAVLRDDLKAVRHASGPSGPTFRIQREDVREWLIRSLVVNREEP